MRSVKLVSNKIKTEPDNKVSIVRLFLDEIDIDTLTDIRSGYLSSPEVILLKDFISKNQMFIENQIEKDILFYARVNMPIMLLNFCLFAASITLLHLPLAGVALAGLLVGGVCAGISGVFSASLCASLIGEKLSKKELCSDIATQSSQTEVTEVRFFKPQYDRELNILSRMTYLPGLLGCDS